MSQAKVQEKYFREVLGVGEIVLPPQTSVPSEEPHWTVFEGESSPLVVLSLITNPKESLLEEPQKTVYQKMIGAMKLPSTQPLILEGLCPVNLESLSKQLENLDIKFGLVFSPQKDLLPTAFSSYGIWERFGGGRWLATHHPSHLVENPQQKKEAWGHLQAIMAEISSETPV